MAHCLNMSSIKRACHPLNLPLYSIPHCLSCQVHCQTRTLCWHSATAHILRLQLASSYLHYRKLLFAALCLRRCTSSFAPKTALLIVTLSSKPTSPPPRSPLPSHSHTSIKDISKPCSKTLQRQPIEKALNTSKNKRPNTIMPSKYYESSYTSGSSGSGGEKIYYEPRRGMYKNCRSSQVNGQCANTKSAERREAPTRKPATKREVEVHHHYKPSEDERRPKNSADDRWR
jgi:hypothetical protein